MSIVKSILLATELATRRRDQAAAVLAQAQKTEVFAQGQLAQLEGYGVETESNWIRSAQASTAPELMRNHYQFMARLGEAIGLQKNALQNAGRQVAREKKALLETELRLSSLKKILAIKQTEIERVQAKRDQKQMDEFAALQYSRSMAERNQGESL